MAIELHDPRTNKVRCQTRSRLGGQCLRIQDHGGGHRYKAQR